MKNEGNKITQKYQLPEIAGGCLMVMHLPSNPNSFKKIT